MPDKTKKIPWSKTLTTLPMNRTICSLNKKQILELPGFGHLKNYYCKDVKKMVRFRITHEWKCKKRGFKVQDYIDNFKKRGGGAFFPSTHYSYPKKKNGEVVRGGIPIKKLKEHELIGKF